MNLIGLLLILSLIFNVLLALFVHFRSSRSVANVSFEMAIYAIICWTISMIFYRLVGLDATALWARLLYFSASFTAPSFLLFSLYFPQERTNKIFIAIIALLTGVVAVLSLIPGAIIKEVIIIPGEEKYIYFGWAYPFYIIHISGLFTIFYAVLLYKFIHFRKTNFLVKLQIQYVLLSTGIVSTLAMMTNLFLPTMGIFRFNWLGQVLTALWVGGISYAIVRHRLMDIRFVVARTVAYTLLITIISVFYVSASFVLSVLFLGFTTAQNQLVIYALLTLAVALSFERLKQLVENLTDKVFFKGRYDTNLLLSELSSIMSTNIELQPLTSQILQTMRSQMRISRGTFVLLGKDTIYDIISEGFDSKPNYFYQQLSPFLSQPEIVVFEELEEGDLKQLLRQMNLTISAALKVEDEVVGLLLLGEKASGEMYSDQDLKVLNILAPEAAVAIQNAKAYEEIRRFNITLQEEVDKATKDLQIANERLKQLDKLKDDFVSITSHELRTPMTAIRSYSWMALHKSDIPLSQKLQRYLYRTLISTERLINLVNDMLNVSRIESGHIEISPKPFDLKALVKDIMEEVHARADEKELKLLVLEDKMPKVLADSDKVSEILLNLLGNSIKFTPPGGTILISFFTDGKVVETSVKDSGAGIVKEDLGRLFRKFGRLDNSYVSISTSGGTGLGLYISKSLIELMHGKIWASSEGMGKGTTFTFSLPVATQDTLAHGEQYQIKARGEAKGLEPVAI